MGLYNGGLNSGLVLKRGFTVILMNIFRLFMCLLLNFRILPCMLISMEKQCL